jgi:hypothetical protein
LGYPSVTAFAGGTGGNGRYISRVIPDFIPWVTSYEGEFDVARPFLYCTSVTIEPAGDAPADGTWFGDWGENRYGSAFLEARYETLTYDILSDNDMKSLGLTDPTFGTPDESNIMTGRYVTVETGISEKYQTLPQGSFVLVSGDSVNGRVYPGSPGRIELKGDLRVTWHQVPRAAVGYSLVNPWIAKTTSAGGTAGTPYVPPLEDCLGAVNLNDIWGRKKGTLLMTAAVIKRIRSPLGTRLYDVEMIFDWFGATSATKSTVAGVNDFSRGHNCVLYYGDANGLSATPTPGYYEIVRRPSQPIGGGPPSPPTSNYLLTAPADYGNLMNYRDFASLFRVPALKVDPGNA